MQGTVYRINKQLQLQIVVPWFAAIRDENRVMGLCFADRATSRSEMKVLCCVVMWYRGGFDGMDKLVLGSLETLALPTLRDHSHYIS